MDRLSANKNKSNGNTNVALFCLLGFLFFFCRIQVLLAVGAFLFATAMGHSSIRTFYYVLSLSESSEPC